MGSAAEVRIASPGDLSALERELPMATPERHRECLAQRASGRISYLVAWRGAAPVGHGLIHWAGPRDPAVAAQLPRCPELFDLGVREALRSQGVGSALVAALEELARARGHAQIGLGVALENRRARELYARLGYRESGAPEYVDRWRAVDASGAEHRFEDRCSFLMKSLARAD